MNKVACLLIVFGLILGFSMRTVVVLINRPATQNDQTSEIRFKFLLAFHLIFFIYALLMACKNEMYLMVLTSFVTFLLVAIGCSLCEMMVRTVQRGESYEFTHLGSPLDDIQLTYLDVYFLLYMYSLIGLLSSGLFLLTTETLIFKQQYLYNHYKESFLTKKSFGPEQEGLECAICLIDFNEEDKTNLLEINNCKHLFHETCLSQWLRYNDTCPLDRIKIFEQQDNAPLEE